MFRHRAFAIFIRQWLLPIGLVLAVFLPFRAAVADWYHVPSGSMRPTILEGDRIFVQNIAFGLRVPLTTTWLWRWDSPDRGEIVTLASPVDGTRLVKRVVGVSGDRIAMRGKRLIVNGSAVVYRDPVEVEERLPDGGAVAARIFEEALPGRTHPVILTRTPTRFGAFAELTVPEGFVFVMGDNRDMSFDSRGFGLVPTTNVYGRSSHVVLSGDPDRLYLPRLERWFRRLI